MAFVDVIGALRIKAPKRVVPVLPEQKMVVLPSVEDDLADREPIVLPEVLDAPPLGLFIVYRDSAGKASQRRITCKCFESDKGNLLAWCHERSAMRRFKVHRIEEAIVLGTGEIVDVAEFMSAVPKGESPVGDRALQRLLTVLVFTMKCDGRADVVERDEIEMAAASYAMRFEKDDQIVAQATRRAMGLSPDIDDLIAALRWIEAHNDGKRLARLLLPYVERVIVADGRIASQEAYFGGMIGDALKAIIDGVDAF